MTDQLAILGGTPIRRSPYPGWPQPSVAVEDALIAVARSGHWWQSGGGAAERLEATLVRDFDVAGAVAVANGTVALEIALRALGIRAGDEVLVAATTFVSSATAVHAVGAQPIPVDVDPVTLTVDVGAAGAARSARTRALIAVHLAGQAADLAAVRAFCDEHQLALVEDSAQAITAAHRGARVGSAGDLTTLSFQAAKLISGGDGGAILIGRDHALTNAVRRIANCGRDRGAAAYDHLLPATNGRISEFNAAVAQVHFDGYEQLFGRRSAAAARLASVLPAGSMLLPGPGATRHDWYMVLMKTPPAASEAGLTNAQTVSALAAEGIPAQVLYPTWSDLPAFRRLRERSDERFDGCPVSREATRRVVWLHHRLLLDDRFPDDLAAAWGKLEAGYAGLLARGDGLP